MSETWSQLTDADVLGELTQIEKTMLTTLRNNEDNLPAIIARVANQVRKAYLDGGRNVDANAGTIPDGEFPRAIAIARWQLLTSYPALKSFQTADRKAVHDEAQTYLLQIAKRELTGDGGSQVVSSQTRRATRCKFEGLI